MVRKMPIDFSQAKVEIEPEETSSGSPLILPNSVNKMDATSNVAKDTGVKVDMQLAIQLTMLSVAVRLMYLKDKIERRRRGETFDDTHEADDRREYTKLEQTWTDLGEENQKRVMLFAVDNANKADDAIKMFRRGFGYNDE